MTVLICTTCPRYDVTTSGSFVQRWVEACKRVEADDCSAPTLRRVQCLGGCPSAGVVAVDGPQKARVRFTNLAAANDDVVAELRRFAAEHKLSVTGDPREIGIPELLKPHLSSVTRKRGPR